MKDRPDFPAAYQKKILMRSGVPEDRIIVEDYDVHTFEAALKLVRGNEALELAHGFRALGSSRKKIMVEFAIAKAAGKVLMDTETKQRSDSHGVEMLDAALAIIHRERTGPTPEEAEERGRNGAAVRWKEKQENRMAHNSARTIWLNKRIATNAQALEKMTGWTRGTAYDAFGASGRPSGNPGRKT